MSASADIKKGVIQKLSTLSLFNKVYGYEKLNPTGFPCAFVTVKGVQNEFFTTAENKRIFGFRILVLMQGGQGLVGDANTDETETAEQAIQDLVGQAIDAFDSDITLDGNWQAIFVEAAVGNYGYLDFEGGWARTAEIELNVHSLYLV